MGLSSFSPRPATEDDIPSIRKIEAETYGGSAWTEEHFKAELEKPFCEFWVITDDETDEEIYAYLVFWIIDERIQILNLTVEGGVRRSGLGSAFLQSVIQLSLREGVKRISLEVRKSNLDAINFYQRLRFSITAIRKGFYSDGEDAYVMDLDLDSPLQHW